MELTPGPLGIELAEGIAGGGNTPDDWMAELGSLLGELETVTVAVEAAPATVVNESTERQLVHLRLGTAASLFAALRCKHPASTAHSLRVALTCSAWCSKMGVSSELRGAIEVAALLHDVGMIGVPDRVLLKPGALEPEEAALMASGRAMSLDIIHSGCTSREILSIVENIGAWFDGSHEGFSVSGKGIPLGARMITVAEAYDSMTSDHVYRAARSRERAMVELFQCAGTQFDPDVVRLFAAFQNGNPASDYRTTADQWLQTLDPQFANAYWELGAPPAPAAGPDLATLFQSRLLDNMYDAVLFIDASSRVRLWNRGAERLTGIGASSIRQRLWTPTLLQMTDEKGDSISDADCPVHGAIRSGVQSLRRLGIHDRSGRSVAVHAHAIPVTTEGGVVVGAILLFRDVSSEISLEQRCETLYEKSTKDPMTQVANRAEFDRVHEMFIAAHRQQQVPCSLIMCDLDKFKSVNDTYGHQAGDEAIKSLAALLRTTCRAGDLVARYGGEEFVVLCADSDNNAATRRADHIRKTLCQTPQASMGGRTISASFGVTEIQPGDTAETMLRRADRAMLMAKERGRNMVVQLGGGATPEDAKSAVKFFGAPPSHPGEMIEQEMTTPVPIRMAIEKLRGFVADHQAKIVSADGDSVSLEMSGGGPAGSRRASDRPVAFLVDLRLTEEKRPHGSAASDTSVLQTRIRAGVRPRRNRDRRRENTQAAALEMLASLKSYLMAVAEAPPREVTPPRDVSRTLAERLLWPWRGKKKTK